jgi:hypothetical protein
MNRVNLIGYYDLAQALSVNILFASDALSRQCHDGVIASRAFDASVARKLRTRLDDLHAAAHLGYAAFLPGRFRPLSRKGHFALSLSEGIQLVLAPADRPLPEHPDGSVDLDRVLSVTIISIGPTYD